LNEAGSTRRKIVTAYRENAVQIGCCLEALGPLTPGELRKMDTGAKTASILAKNFYGWFERVGPGLYALTGRGAAEIQQYPELVAIYAGRAAGAAATCEEAPR